MSYRGVLRIGKKNTVSYRECTPNRKKIRRKRVRRAERRQTAKTRGIKAIMPKRNDKAKARNDVSSNERNSGNAQIVKNNEKHTVLTSSTFPNVCQ